MTRIKFDYGIRWLVNVTHPLIQNAHWFRSTVLLITKTSIIMYNVSALAFAFWVSCLFLADVRPNRINWNIDTWTKLWASETTPLETIQITNFDYSPPDQNQALRDAANIERFIKERIRSWRMGKLTRFRSDISSMMKAVLVKCETSKMECRPIEPFLTSQISEKFKQSKVIGFPLNIRRGFNHFW